MRRRAFVAGMAAAAATASVEAQQAGKQWRIGILLAGDAAKSPGYAGLLPGLRDFGYIERRNMTLDVRMAHGRYEALPELAAALVRTKPDVIVTSATPSAIAAKNATTTIPIVALLLGDPVASGVARNLARPEGNVTGISLVNPELAAKRLDLVRQFLPRLSRLAILSNSLNQQHERDIAAIRPAARDLSIRLQVIDARTPDDMSAKLTAAMTEQPEALLVLADSLLVGQRRAIIDFARAHRLPDIHPYKQMAEDGGVMAYGLDLIAHYRRGAYYVDRILRGALPVDLPFEQPDKFELVINARAVKALGLTIPPSLLLRADQVIE